MGTLCESLLMLVPLLLMMMMLLMMMRETMRREFPVGPHDDGRLLEPQGRDPVHHRRDPQARGFPPGTLSWALPLGPPVR